MEVDTAKTMWTESNINNRQQRIILRYIRSVFGKKCLIASTERKGLQEMRNRANYFSPISNLGEIVMDEEEIHYWTKNVLDVLNFSVITRMFNSPENK